MNTRLASGLASCDDDEIRDLIDIVNQKQVFDRWLDAMENIG